MNILMASDLHLEFYTRESPNGLHGLMSSDRSILPLDPKMLRKVKADILVLAGDIITLRDTNSMFWLKDFADQIGLSIIYVLGNHEFYGSEFTDARQRVKNFFSETNVFVLDNDRIEINDVRFIGSTLWTDYDAAGRQQVSMTFADRVLNDSRLIRIEKAGRTRPFTSVEAFYEHKQARGFIEAELLKSFDGKTVVITHHAPSVTYGQHPKYPLDELSGAFSSDLEYLFPSVDLWIWGHTHASVDMQVGRTRLISNQRGYPDESVPGGYDPLKYVVV